MLDDVEAIEGPNWYADRASLTVSRAGETVLLQPQKRIYPAARMPTTETAIHSFGTSDLYLALGDRRTGEGAARWTFEIFINPMISLVYWGVCLIGLGGVLSLLPRRGAGAAG